MGGPTPLTPLARHRSGPRAAPERVLGSEDARFVRLARIFRVVPDFRFSRARGRSMVYPVLAMGARTKGQRPEGDATMGITIRQPGGAFGRITRSHAFLGDLR